MGKETGLGANFYVDGYDLSGDTSSLQKISKALVPWPFTGIDKFAFERTAGQLDGGIDWTTYFNPTNAHAALSTLPRTDRIVTYLHKATVLGTPSACMIGKQINYDPNREENGGLTMKVQSNCNAFWVDWGYSLTTGKRTDTAATNGTGVDFANQGAPANFGAQFYLQMFAFTGTSVTIAIEDSADNVSFAALASATFTAVSSAPQSQRIQTARNATTRRYLRAVTTGTFSSAQFNVVGVVNRTDMTI